MSSKHFHAFSTHHIFSRWLPWLILLVVIFCLSHQDKNETTLKTGLLSYILSLFDIDGAKLMSGPFRLIIRKLAHMVEYALLFLLSYRVADLYWKLPEKRWLSFFFCFLYASTDEFHQTFIWGRYGTPVDVGIDMLGASAMLLVILLWERRKASLNNS